MKQRKLTPRFVVVAIILIMAGYFLYPTFRYELIRQKEENKAQKLAEEMGLSYSYVIESLYKDESILREKLETLDIAQDKKEEITEDLKYLQGSLQEKSLKFRKKAIKRGLDLQGGMHLVLEVDLIQLLKNMARQRDAKLEQLLSRVDEELRSNPGSNFGTILTDVFEYEGVKLSQYFGEAGESNASIINQVSKQSEDAINRSLEILRNRIDQFGVSEPSIQKQGNRRIILELPGVQDPARARDLIGRTAMLEFKLLSDPEKAQELLQAIDKHLAEKREKEAEDGAPASDEFDVLEEEQAEPEKSAGQEEIKPDEDMAAAANDTADTDEDALDLSADIEDMGAADTTEEEATEFDTSENPFTSLLRGIRGDIAVPQENVRKVRTILADPEVKKIFPEDTQFLWGAKPEDVGDGNKYHILYLVKYRAQLTGAGLADARVDISSGYNNPGTAGQPIVSLSFNRAGGRTFSRVTGANIGKRLAIVLDEKVYMAPNIRSKITAGSGAIIEGVGTVEEAEDIAIVLRAGALPTSVLIEEERTVGPSLGRDSIRKGATSAIIGMILVIIFMVIYYGMSGIIANVALILNIVFIFAGLAFFGAMGMGATLSLPGIAGIILTIGMAVDANVLIFERIREELDTGKTVWHAVSSGYDRAFSTILDANVTTLIAALVLLQFGSGPIRGFAVTLSIGIVSSLFTAIVVTRLIFDYITSKRNLQRLSI